jgi:Virulence factor
MSATDVARATADVENVTCMSRKARYLDATEGSVMAEVTIVYWRDIPAQVIVGKGRRGVKKPLPERFEQAIDRAAMKAGMAGTDDYLSEWRKADPVTVEGEDETVATAEAARIDRDYDKARLMTLIDNKGWA